MIQQGLLALFAFGLMACSQPQLMTLQGNTMGTTYSIKLPRPPKNIQQTVLQAEVDTLLAQINAEMSTYDPHSELSRLNQAPGGQWLPVSAGLMQVLQAAAAVHSLSGGVFDPTVGPLVNLWGFGPGKNAGFPDKKQVAAARQSVGYARLVELDVDQTRLRKRDGLLYLDLSAIAKGYAVDKVAELLQAHEVSEYMVEIGGEIRVSGSNASRQPWRLAVENPSPTGRSVHGLLAVSDAAVATSGDYRNYFEHEGKRYSHTIDPRSGYPVSHAMVSVTVIHPQAMLADALATALMVLGPVEGMALAKAKNLAVWLIVRDGEKWIDLYSPAMQAYRVNFDS